MRAAQSETSESVRSLSFWPSLYIVEKGRFMKKEMKSRQEKSFLMSLNGL